MTEQHHQYPPHTAGYLMIESIPKVEESATIADVENVLQKNAHQFGSIAYIYVVTKGGKLKGVLSIRDIFRLPKTTTVSAHMIRDMVVTRAHTHQELVAYRAVKYNVKAIPVVDNHRKLLGVVTGDTILSILHSETRQDLLQLAGIHEGKESGETVLTTSLWKSLVHRVPWLLIGLVGGILSVYVIGSFEQTLEQHIILAAFIPLIVYMSDAVRVQMEAFIIRDLAFEKALPFARYAWKQLRIIFLMALLFGACLFLFIFLVFKNTALGMAVGLSLTMAIVSSIVTGICIPYIFSRLRFDPANASGPVGTIIQDIMSITIYFSIATWVI